MHGVILYHLRQFAVERFGPDCWDNAQAAAGLEDQVYVPVRLYPDGDMDALVAALEDETALHRNDLLEAFGKWVIPPLINMYRALIPRRPSTMSLRRGLGTPMARPAGAKPPCSTVCAK